MISPCLHRATFMTRFRAKAFLESSRLFSAYWHCPRCRFWVAGDFAEAPVETLSQEIGIFIKPQPDIPDHE